MKLYRYMSITEFVKMSYGMNMTPYHIKFEGARTNSQGFCFLGEKIMTNTSHKFTPEEALDFLPTTVSRDILVEFETTENLDIKKGYGIYQNPFGINGDLMEITEYSMLQYNNSTLIPTRFILNPEPNFSEQSQKNEWEKFDPKTHYSIRDYLTETLLQTNGTSLFPSELRFLPPLPNSNENECWRYFEEPSTELGMIYGNSVNDTEKYKISFKKIGNDTYRISQMNDVPDFWKEIYDPNLELNTDMALDFLIYASLAAHFPELGISYYPEAVDTPYGKQSILMDYEHHSFNMSKLTLCLTENNQLDIGEYDQNHNFISLLDILSKEFNVKYDLKFNTPLQQKDAELYALEVEEQKITETEKLVNAHKIKNSPNKSKAEVNIGE